MIRTLSNSVHEYFVGDRKVTNPKDPIKDWVLSSRKSPRALKQRYFQHDQAFLPETAEEAWELLQRCPAIQVTFDDVSWSESRYLQQIWAQLEHPGVHRICGRDSMLTHIDFLGLTGKTLYLGNKWWFDGGKVPSGVLRVLGKDQPAFVVLKREWLAQWAGEHADLLVEFK